MIRFALNTDFFEKIACLYSRQSTNLYKLCQLSPVNDMSSIPFFCLALPLIKEGCRVKSRPYLGSTTFGQPTPQDAGREQVTSG